MDIYLQFGEKLNECAAETRKVEKKKAREELQIFTLRYKVAAVSANNTFALTPRRSNIYFSV